MPSTTPTLQLDELVHLLTEANRREAEATPDDDPTWSPRHHSLEIRYPVGRGPRDHQNRPGLHIVLTANWASGHAEPYMVESEIGISILDDVIVVRDEDLDEEERMPSTAEGMAWLRRRVRCFLGLDPAAEDDDREAPPTDSSP